MPIFTALNITPDYTILTQTLDYTVLTQALNYPDGSVVKTLVQIGNNGLENGFRR